VKVPRVDIVAVNDCPGESDGELQAPPSAVDVCAMLSLLVHVTIVPAATVSGFGEYAVVVSVDEFATIDTAVVPVPDEGDEGEEDELHAVVSATAAIAISTCTRI
jgi:hypothetical protein